MNCPFVFFERANVPSIAPVLAALARRGRLEPSLVRAFDYKELVGEIGPVVPPPGITLHELPVAPVRARADLAPRRADRPGLGAKLHDELLARPLIPMLVDRVEAIAASLEVLLRALRPPLIVVPEDTDYAKGRLASRVARELAIPTVAVLPTWHATIARYPLLGPRLCDHYVAMNDATRTRLVGHGADPDRVHVLGGPFFEGIARAQRPLEPTFVVALQGTRWEATLLEDLRAIFARRSSWTLLVKPHPLVAFDASPGLRVVRDRTIRELLAECTGLIAESSIALYEAAAAGVHAIVVSYGGHPPDIVAPSRPVRDPAELEAALVAAVESPPPSPSLVGPSAGSAERIAGLLESVASS